MSYILLPVNPISGTDEKPTHGILNVSSEIAWKMLEVMGFAKKLRALHTTFSFIHLSENPVVWISLNEHSKPSILDEDFAKAIDQQSVLQISDATAHVLISETAIRFEETEGLFTGVAVDGVWFGLEVIESEPQFWDTPKLYETFWLEKAA